jgi:hypothetical protein
MKSIFRALAVAVGLVASFTAYAGGVATFDFNYTFDTGQVITGSFNGVENGNLITNLSNISVSLNGTPFNGSGNLFGSSYTAPGSDCSTCWTSGDAVASVNGLQSNFLFIDSNYPSNGTYSNYFYVIPWPNGSQPNATQAVTPSAGIVDYYNGNYSAANWSVHEVASPVPEPDMLLMLLIGLVLVVFVTLKKRVPWMQMA